MSKQHTIALGGLNFVPDMSGALFLPDEKLLLVADLHLEQGASLARRGLHVPPYDTSVTLGDVGAGVASDSSQALGVARR